MSLTLDQLNAATPGDALAMLDGTYEHSPWIAERALAARPFRSLAQLKHALVQAVAAASADEKLGLIRAHPCLLYTSPSPRDRQKSRMPSSA